MVGLRLHARLGDAVDNVGNHVDNGGDLTQVRDADGRQVADARQALHAVIKANDATITDITRQIVLVHHGHSRGADTATHAAESLHTVAKARAVLFAPTRLPAADTIIISLAASVIVHVSLQNFITQSASRALRTAA